MFNAKCSEMSKICYSTVSLVLGVPTVRRQVQSYLMTTLGNLITSMTPLEMKECIIVVFVAEVRLWTGGGAADFSK